jgi:catechol 2,3-dioxygenase-like lactoylglutathione lyase family enzyme
MSFLFLSATHERTARFYEALGVGLVSEQHGAGPQHYSFQAPAEIYPLREHDMESFRVRIETSDLQEVFARLNAAGFDAERHVRSHTPVASGAKCVMEDPDGRIVEIFAPAT